MMKALLLLPAYHSGLWRNRKRSLHPGRKDSWVPPWGIDSPNGPSLHPFRSAAGFHPTELNRRRRPMTEKGHDRKAATAATNGRSRRGNRSFKARLRRAPLPAVRPPRTGGKVRPKAALTDGSMADPSLFVPTLRRCLLPAEPEPMRTFCVHLCITPAFLRASAPRPFGPASAAKRRARRPPWRWSGPDTRRAVV